MRGRAATPGDVAPGGGGDRKAVEAATGEGKSPVREPAGAGGTVPEYHGDIVAPCGKRGGPPPKATEPQNTDSARVP